MTIMKKYELTIVGRGSLTQEAQDKLVSDISASITKLDGKIEPVESLGKRMLAYDIAKEKEGYYSFLTLSLSPARVGELTLALKTYDGLLRSLFVTRKEKKKKKSDKKKEL